MAGWLRDWSALEEAIADAFNQVTVSYHVDTSRPEAESAFLRFATEIDPQLEPYRVGLSRRLVESGHQREDLEPVLRSMRNRIELFREASVPLVAELERLSSDQNKLVGSMTVEWEGERLTVSQLKPFTGSGDRSVRERAFRAFFSPFLEAREQLSGIFDEMYALRVRMAANAGFDNYRDFAHRDKDRFDYSPDDCLRFHDAVEATVVPAVERIYRRRAELMGLPDGLVRPWDAIDSHVANPDPLGRPLIRAFDGEAGLIETGKAVFERVDPEFGSYFTRQAEAGNLSLMSGPGKTPGAYCTAPLRGLPFILMNSVGVESDVTTLLHEAGHAFHAFEAAAHQELIFQRSTGAEMAEVASMSMELLAAPYLSRGLGGWFEDSDYRRAIISHLEDVLAAIAHIASVDAFQHWIYTDPGGADRDARDAKWLELRARFQRGVDWTGYERERVARWYEQVHIFGYPFYYIEYGIAQMGALQVWRNALADQASAVAAYRRALALGNSRPLPELFAAAGARLVFDREGMAPLVELIEGELARLGALD